MELSWIRPVKLVTRLITEAASAQQIAWGFALGMLLGLVPKGNLTAVFLSMALLSLNVNFSAGVLGALAFSAVSPVLDPLTHRLGYWLLASRSLEPIWVWLSQVPLFPWTRLTNTVVLGNLVLGLWLFLPVWWGVYCAICHGQPILAERLSQLRAVQVLSGLEAVARWRRP